MDSGFYRPGHQAVRDIWEYAAVYCNAKRLLSIQGYEIPQNFEKILIECQKMLDQNSLKRFENDGQNLLDSPF